MCIFYNCARSSLTKTTRVLRHFELAVEHGDGLCVSVLRLCGLGESLKQVLHVHSCIMKKKRVLACSIVNDCPAM